MFGFLSCGREHPAYRQAYARCCSFQHQYFGLESLVLLSYEAVFLYVCAGDAGLVPPPAGDAPTCCRLRTSRRLRHAADAEVARFCTAFGLLLGRIKLEDDLRDEPTWTVRLAARRLRDRFRQASEYFSRLDPIFEQQVARSIDEHLRLERRGEAVRLTDYAAPTAEAFGYVFGLFGRHLADRRLAADADWSQAGRLVGTAIIAHDCATDWQRDQRRGQFNPLRDLDEVQAARLLSQQHLARLGWWCQDQLRGRRSAAVVRSTFDRIARRGNPPANPQSGQAFRAESASAPAAPRYRRWFARRRGECDFGCCDAGCCDAGGGEGCACHGCDGCGGGGAGEHHHAACDGCVVCGDCCVLPCSESSKSRKSNQTTLNSDSTIVGMVGRAVAPLSPTGVVLVADKRVPAKSEGGEWIGAGEAVVVSGVDTFGVLVRPHLPEKPAQNLEPSS